MSANTETLVEQVRDALQRTPGSTARELAIALRSGGTIVTKRDLNPLLYGGRGSFEHDGGHVPRWRLVGQSVARPDLVQRIEDVRRKRKQLDERQELVVQLADVEPPVHTPVPRAAVPRREWLLPLRPWQREAMLAWFDHGCRGVVQAVTGTGKTHLGLEAIAQARAAGYRSTVLVPSALLQRQWNRRIKQFVPRATIAHVGGTALGDRARADVVIAVVNSASTTDLTALGAGTHLLVADEVHRYGGEGWSSALREDYVWRLGLTATLERSADDGVEARLLPYFNRVVFDYGYDRATEEGVVAPFDLVFLGVDLAPELRAEYDELTRKLSQAAKVLMAAGGLPTGLHQQLKRLRALGGRVARAAMSYEAAGRERRRLLASAPAKTAAVRELADLVGASGGTVVFTQTVDVADAVASALVEEGLPAESVHAQQSTRERQRKLDGLEDGSIVALVAPKILDEGVDVPDVDLGIVIGASSSRRQMIQRLGRVIRLKSDGRRARFLVLYVRGTVEDPELGSQQTFMQEAERAASRVAVLQHWNVDVLDEQLGGDRAGPEPGKRPSARVPVQHVTDGVGRIDPDQESALQDEIELLRGELEALVGRRDA